MEKSQLDRIIELGEVVRHQDENGHYAITLIQRNLSCMVDFIGRSISYHGCKELHVTSPHISDGLIATIRSAVEELEDMAITPEVAGAIREHVVSFAFNYTAPSAAYMPGAPARTVIKIDRTCQRVIRAAQARSVEEIRRARAAEKERAAFEADMAYRQILADRRRKKMQRNVFGAGPLMER